MTPVVTVEECIDVIRIDGARVDIVTDGTGVIGHDCMLSVLPSLLQARPPHVSASMAVLFREFRRPSVAHCH